MHSMSHESIDLRGALLAAGVLLSACFNPQGSPGASDGETSEGVGATDGATSTSTGEATGTTGSAPLPTFRMDSVVFVEPHLFLAGNGCADGTELLNISLANDIEVSNMDMLVQLVDDFGELRLVDGNCDPPEGPGGAWTCSPKDSVPAIILQSSLVTAGECWQLDPAVLAADNPIAMHEPQAPCVRTTPAKFSFPIGELGAISFRDSQVAGELGSASLATTERIEQGLLYGFLPRAVAEQIDVDIPAFPVVNLWAAIEAVDCTPMYPGLLPNVDMLQSDGGEIPGVWVVLNFTAYRIDAVASGDSA